MLEIIPKGMDNVGNIRIQVRVYKSIDVPINFGSKLDSLGQWNEAYRYLWIIPHKHEERK